MPKKAIKQAVLDTATIKKTLSAQTKPRKKAVPAVDSPTVLKPKGRREEKHELTRKRLFEATIQLVGDVGHAGTTIRSITSRARIAQGTFYNYFSSQQDIFDQILPYLGNKLLNYLDERFEKEANFIDRQDLFLVAFDDFLRETPAFYRVMTEAEVFAPKSYRLYIANTVDWFIRHFSDDPKQAELNILNRQQLEIVGLMVMASSHYINMRFGDWLGDTTRMPAWVVETFHNFVQGGISSVSGGLSTQAYTSDQIPDAALMVRKSDPDLAKDANNQALTEGFPSQNFVKFTPHNVGNPAEISYSAQSIQIDCRLTPVSPGHVILELDIDRRTLNSRGVVAGGTLSVLIEMAAGAVMAYDRAEQVFGETIGLNCTMIRPAMEGVLVAEAKVENAGRNIRFVTVRVTLDHVGGPLIASGTATMRVME